MVFLAGLRELRAISSIGQQTLFAPKGFAGGAGRDCTKKFSDARAAGIASSLGYAFARHGSLSVSGVRQPSPRGSLLTASRRDWGEADF